jgi:hypothetical protein
MKAFGFALSFLIALIQIKKRRQRDKILAESGMAAFVFWATVSVYQVSTGQAWWQHRAWHRATSRCAC